MPLSKLAVATACTAASLLAPPVQASSAGVVTVSITGARTARGAVAACVAQTQPFDATARVEVECSSDIMVSWGQGLGAAASEAVGVFNRTICAYAHAAFTDGTVDTASTCRTF